MRRLGSDLQVTAMSFYTHFSTKEAILTATAELIFAEVVIPPENPDWEEFSRDLFSAFRRVLLAHPNAVPLLVRRTPRSLAALAPIEASVRSLRQAGFDRSTALDGHRALMSFTVGYLLQEVARFEDSNVDPESWGTGFYALDELTSQETPYLLELAPVALQREADDQFAAILSRFLKGLGLSLDSQQRTRDAPGP